MPRPKHLTFANVTAVAALVIATTGGGFAVAASLGKNVVGSAQIKKNAVKSADVKNDGLTGKDIKESTLGSVPSAAKATTVDSIVTKKATATPGQTLALVTSSTFVVELSCVDTGGGDLDARLGLRTTTDNASFDANAGGDDEPDLDVADLPAEIAFEDGLVPDMEDSGFSALSAAGVSLKGYGFVMVHPGGANTCAAEVTIIG
jgi:hypothetical protein